MLVFRHMKAAIILDEGMGAGLLANATACITTGLFNEEENVLGEKIEGADHTFIPITKIPILVLKKDSRDFLEMLSGIDGELKSMVLTKEAQSTTSYEEYIERVQGKRLAELTIVGVGIIGDDKLVQKVVGNLPLLR